jgi:hypothetical protein
MSEHKFIASFSLGGGSGVRLQAIFEYCLATALPDCECGIATSIKMWSNFDHNISYNSETSAPRHHSPEPISLDMPAPWHRHSLGKGWGWKLELGAWRPMFGALGNVKIALCKAS